jgi:hypothetical protein
MGSRAGREEGEGPEGREIENLMAEREEGGSSLGYGMAWDRDGAC